MDNSGKGPLRVPGFGNTPLHFELPCSQRFAHGVSEWDQRPTVTAREAAMVDLMNTLTDKCNWNIDIFDDVVVSRWHEEAISSRNGLISEMAWQWCVRELRDKAEMFRQKQFVRVLDTGSCVCKSDSLLPHSFAAELKRDLQSFYPKNSPIRTRNDGTLNVVDPSMYPLVFGTTPVLSHGECVELDDLFGAYSRAAPAPAHSDKRTDSAVLQDFIQTDTPEKWNKINGIRLRWPYTRYYWSSNFQWLPCELEFPNHGASSIRISSYINGLHADSKALYGHLERLIGCLIQPWNECLVRGQDDWKREGGRNDYNNQRQRGPVPLRIVTYGAEYVHEKPEWAMAFSMAGRRQMRKYLEARDFLQSEPPNDTRENRKKIEEARKIVQAWGDEGPPTLPQLTPEIWRQARELLELPETGSQGPATLPADWYARSDQLIRDKTDLDFHTYELISEKIERIQYWKHPEPGAVVSYDDWKDGNENHRAVVEVARKVRGVWEEKHAPTDARHSPHTIQLQETFRDAGLQMIVKIGGVELTPNLPKHVGGIWELPGQLNEHIVATAIYAYDVSNVTECRLTFRQENYMNQYCYRYRNNAGSLANEPGPRLPLHRPVLDDFGPMAAVFGTTPEDLDEVMEFSRTELPMQDVGSVVMRQGRLITFPNVMEYSHLPFELVDPTRPGHYRCITVYLVDPHYRVCSTRNVPPQQHDWWSVPVARILMQKGLPRELAEYITGECQDGFVSSAQAEVNRQAMAKEHKWMDLARYRSMQPRWF